MRVNLFDFRFQNLICIEIECIDDLVAGWFSAPLICAVLSVVLLVPKGRPKARIIVIAGGKRPCHFEAQAPIGLFLTTAPMEPKTAGQTGRLAHSSIIIKIPTPEFSLLKLGIRVLEV